MWGVARENVRRVGTRQRRELGWLEVKLRTACGVEVRKNP
jgi:hypothetical protein